jgi:hypothetical protein
MIVNAFPDNQDLFKDPRLDYYFKDWDGVCMFGISPTSTYGVGTASFAILGDTFLRSAYVVYDLANEEVGIAEACHNNNESSVVDLKANSKLPDVSGVPGKFPTDLFPRPVCCDLTLSQSPRMLPATFPLLP